MLADILIGAAAVFFVALMLWKVFRKKKGGCSGCSGCSGCDSCPSAGKCSSKAKKD